MTTGVRPYFESVATLLAFLIHTPYKYHILNTQFRPEDRNGVEDEGRNLKIPRVCTGAGITCLLPQLNLFSIFPLYDKLARIFL